MLPVFLGIATDSDGCGALVVSSCTCSLAGTSSSGLSWNRQATWSSPSTPFNELIYMMPQSGHSYGSWLRDPGWSTLLHKFKTATTPAGTASIEGSRWIALFFGGSIDMGPSRSQLRYSLALQAVGTLYQGRGEAHADTGTSIASYCLRIGIPRGSNVLLGGETAHNLPSFWNFPEVKEMIGLGHLKPVRFDQSQMEHARRKPTTILGNLPGLEQLDGLRDSSRRSDPLPRGLQESMEASKDWASWAPGLVMALKEALRAHLHQRDQCLAQRIHKLNVEEWKQHVRAHHHPYRRVCRRCMELAGVDSPHRRSHADSSAHVLSMGLVGPYSVGRDDGR